MDYYGNDGDIINGELELMSDLDKFKELVDEIWLIVFGTERVSKLRKRARNKDGTYKGDDKSTPNKNEAWE